MRSWFAALLACALVACGGSGGGGSGSAVAVVAPIIAVQPRPQTTGDGQSATFSVVATGTPPFNYQWSRGGQPIAGATGASFTVATAQLGDNGATFAVGVSNVAGTTQSTTATLTVSPVAPSIANDMARTIGVVAGSTATVSVVAGGSLPLSFQWRRGGIAIAGATSSTYTTPATTLADNGAVLDVVLTNSAGTVVSAPFTLAVTANPNAPSIATQPQSVTVHVGSPASFSVVANGAAPLTYQWLRDGQAISGAQGASYTLSSTLMTDNGAQFSVVVANASGTVTSASATLTVAPQAGIALLAGNIGGSGYINDVGVIARFVAPANVAVDNAGNLFVADGQTVRRISPTGVVSTIAGSPTASGSNDGAANAATFRNIAGIAVDASGNVYVADSANETIRKITAAGIVSTLAGTTGVTGTSDGNGTAALFNAPAGVATDGLGDVYVADTGNDTIRKISAAGVVTTIAGSGGTAGSADGIGAAAQFNQPRNLVVDAALDVYVADTGNDTVRMISAAGVVTTVAGSVGNAATVDGTGMAARFNVPSGIALDQAGNLYVSEVAGQVVRKIVSGGLVTTVAGMSGTSGSADGAGGAGGAARFFMPSGIASNASGLLYVADDGNTAVRSISTNGVVATLAGAAAVTGSADGTGTAATFDLPFSLAVDRAGNIYIGDFGNATIRKITPANVVTTLAGSPGMSGSADGAGGNARFRSIEGLVADGAGNLYVADRDNQTIRKITPGGVVTTLAGSPGIAGAADGTGSAASFNLPTALTIDAGGNLYVVDANPTVRMISPAGVVTTIAGRAGQTGSADGTGSAASFNRPQGIAIDAVGNLYVTDSMNSTVRKITSAGVVTTIAGSPGVVGTTDGPAASARFTRPFGIALDVAGDIYLSDIVPPTVTISSGGFVVTNQGSHTLRRIDPAGNVTTVAGVADDVSGTLLGVFPGHFSSLTEIAFDPSGNLIAPDANGVLRLTFP